jgi:ATP-dependent helicase HrpB
VSAAAERAQHPLARALRAGLAQHRDAVLQAPAGAGKSTLVPLALLEGATGAGKILMLEPRRLAARAVAARMASLLGETVGATVGYRMRLDTRVSKATRIEVITEGVLTRLLQEDPALEGVDWLLFDEFHERSLQADLGLALALDAREQLEAAFRILIMSATLEPSAVAQRFGDAAVVSVPGRLFEIEIHYLGRGLPLLPGAPGAPSPTAVSGRMVEQAVGRAVQRALSESSGDVLVFLPGVGEIRRVEALLRESVLPPHVQLLPLHGQLASEAQDAALVPAMPPWRRVVLATNVAETSLTVPGVTAVVDSGLVRRARFDPTTGMSRLELSRISRASSEQRAGRAGRLGPGACYRLWSAGAQEQLSPATPAEILEADLAPLALDLARWGADDATRLRWLDVPPAAALSQARELLQRLEALDTTGRLTTVGQQMARLAVHPRLAHMLLRSRALNALPLAARLAALLSERDLLRGERDPDVRSRLERLPGDSSGAAERIRRSAATLERAASAASDASAAPPPLVAAFDTNTLPGALLALAFPDRIGQRREGAPGRYLLSNGRGAAFPGPTALAREPYIVAVALDDRAREATIELAAPLSQPVLETLFAAQIEIERALAWEEAHGGVQLREIRRFQALRLEERRLPLDDEAQAVPIVLQWLQRQGVETLPWDPESRELQGRIEFVRGLGRPELTDWPASDDATLAATLPEWLAPFLIGVTRADHLARLPLRPALLARLTSAQRRVLDQLAPTELPLPKGRRGRLDYSDPQGPRLSVRLQDAFGMRETPRIGGGAVALTLVLLSPARRPVQITRDLAGFWRGSYAEVRKQLRGRYPKHAWPEDPLQAP